MLPVEQTLAAIRTRLIAREKPQDIITSLLPADTAQAVAWGRRLPLWAEYADRYGEQTVALARVVSKRSMRLHGLALDEHGDIVPAHHSRPAPGKEHAFTLDLGGVPVRIVHTPGYFNGTDHLQFTGPAVEGSETPGPIPFTGGSWYSHFTPSDAVAGMGGPEAYARAYADAGPDRDDVFHAAFVGELPVFGKAVRGRHTAKVVEQERVVELSEPDAEQEKPAPPQGVKTQGRLF